MLKQMFAALAVAVLAAPLVAQPVDHIKAREELMEKNGKDAKAGGAMLKGEVPFDAARAQAILAGMNAVSKEFGQHFPKGSDPASNPKSKTEASPAIWTKPAEWNAALAKFQKDTAAAVAAKPATVQAFGQQFGMVTQNCKSCHEAFRIKRD